MNTGTIKVRLQKFLADQGLCSRRRGEIWIEDGLVTINGKMAEIGQKIDPCKDLIAVKGKPVPQPSRSRCTLMMNKPKGLICSNRDPHHCGQTVFDLLPPAYAKERLYCAGRLDKESEGLLILTNDGNLTHRLTHPRNGVVKRYRVVLNQPFHDVHLELLRYGIVVDGERLQAEKVIPGRKGPDLKRHLEIHLQHGRKREIRRMLEALGYRVKRLCRFQIGHLMLRGLGPGRCRPLKEKDLYLLFG